MSGGSGKSAVQEHSDKVIARSQRRSIAVYLLASLAYALVMTVSWSLMAGGALSPGRLVMLMSIFLWPGIITIAMTCAVDRRDRLFLFATYLLILLAAISFVIFRNPGLHPASLAGLWMIINLPVSVLMVFFLHHRIRAVGPLVYTFMLCGVTGAVLLILLLDGNDTAQSTVASLGDGLGLGASSLFVLIQLSGFVLFAVLGRLLLRRIGSAYRAKRCSDRSITLDALWAMFAVTQSVGFAFEGLYWILAGPLAFVAWRSTVSIGFHVIRSMHEDSELPREILLLRVFALGGRSHQFFDKFTRLWREIGIISMIAGPDLVTAAVEPHEFLAFVGGSLSRRFVVDEHDFQKRFSELDRGPDPDGRYRVHEFFCHEDTWRLTVQRLATASDAVLMDLRSFSELNQGCLYELQVLLNTVALSKVVFIIDETTDQSFLKDACNRLWSALDRQSPNATQPSPTVRLFSADVQHRQALYQLISELTR